jgi:peptidoglycan/LPS O-acetylase OafA/YrhL
VRSEGRTRWQLGHVPALTGIRGVAACWVMLFHTFIVFGQITGHPEVSHLSVLGRGYLAVDLFFLLSGYILAATYFSRFATQGWMMTRSFAINRVFRVMPLNFVALSAFLGAVVIFGGASFAADQRDATSFVASAFLVQSWGPFSPTAWNYPAWSLSAEWLAYAGFPVGLLILAATRKPMAALGGALICLILLDAVLATIGNGDLDHTGRLGVVRCVLEFAGGMFFWRWHSLRGIAFAHPDRWAGAAFALVSLSLVGPWWELLAPFGFALLIVVCAERSRSTETLFANPVSVYLGNISFSIYLLHVTVIGIYHVAADAVGIAAAPLFAQWGFLVAMLSTVILIAHLGWRLVEVPGQVFGRRFGASRTVVQEPAL